MSVLLSVADLPRAAGPRVECRFTASRTAVNHAAIRPETDRRRPLTTLNVFWKFSEMAADSSPTYQFGPFRLEVGERRLLCEGRAVPLRTKVFDTLRVLVEHSGRLLTKHELMQSIWPDTVVEENNLNHNISTLRRALGEQVTGQRYIETVPRVGYRFVADVTSSSGVSRPSIPRRQPLPSAACARRSASCTASDGTRIAYSTVGTGPPLVKAANWLNHLEYEWESPVWKHWIDEISRHHMFVRYDERGCGLSDWQVQDLSFEAWVRDLETVVDALDEDRFDLLGISQGGAVAVAYAATASRAGESLDSDRRLRARLAVSAAMLERSKRGRR